MEAGRVSVAQVRSMKGKAGIPVLTAYDYPMARVLEQAGIPVLLVGDSLGMVVLGYPDTTHVTMAEMEHHTRAVVRGRDKALVVVDLPYGSATTPESAVKHARRLVEAGADAVKIEGGPEVAPMIQSIRSDGIEVMGHLGMLPQRVREEGGYRIKGKTDAERDRLIADAHAICDAGVFSIVLELVRPAVAREVTGAVPVPTIGIGSGASCDGQVLVTHDLVGAFPWFTPRFVKPRIQTAAAIQQAVSEWKASVTANEGAV